MPDYDSKNIPVLDDVIDIDNIVDEEEIIELGKIDTSNNDSNDNFDLFADNFTAFDASAESLMPEALSSEHASIENFVTQTAEPEIGNIDDFADQDDDTTTISSVSFSSAVTEQPATESDNETNSTFTSETSEQYSGNEFSDIDIACFDQETDEIIEEEIASSEDVLEIESALISYIADDPALLETERVLTSIDQQDDASIKDNSDTSSYIPISLETISEDIIKQIMPGLEQQLRRLVLQALEEKLPEVFVKSSSINHDQNE